MLKDYAYTFTVFTPTYNRAHTIQRVYDSLKAQTFKDFEWLIVDDGSADDTSALVRRWQNEAGFSIRYWWQENAGKHAAVNRGVAEARGELFLSFDSDNACVPTALERFKFHWDAIPEAEKPKFSAVSALAQDPDGRIVGTPFPFSPTDSDSLEIRLKYKVKGDKWGFHRTEVLRQFPYPHFDGEKLIPDSLVWNRIALKYKTRYVNEPLEIYFTTPDSWSANSSKIRAKSARGSRFYYREYVALDYAIPISQLIRAYANYVRFSYHGHVGVVSQISDIPMPAYWLAAFPIGYLAYRRDKKLLSHSH